MMHSIRDYSGKHSRLPESTVLVTQTFSVGVCLLMLLFVGIC